MAPAPVVAGGEPRSTNAPEGKKDRPMTYQLKGKQDQQRGPPPQPSPTIPPQGAGPPSRAGGSPSGPPQQGPPQQGPPQQGPPQQGPPQGGPPQQGPPQQGPPQQGPPQQAPPQQGPPQQAPPQGGPPQQGPPQQGPPQGGPPQQGDPQEEKHCFKNAGGTEICIAKQWDQYNNTHVFDKDGTYDRHNDYGNQENKDVAGNVPGTNVTEALQGGRESHDGNTLFQVHSNEENSGFRDTHSQNLDGKNPKSGPPQYEDHKEDAGRKDKEFEEHSSKNNGDRTDMKNQGQSENHDLADVHDQSGSTDTTNINSYAGDWLELFHKHHGVDGNDWSKDSSVTKHANVSNKHQQEEQTGKDGFYEFQEQDRNKGSFNFHVHGNDAWKDLAEESSNFPKNFTEVHRRSEGGPMIKIDASNLLEVPVAVLESLEQLSSPDPKVRESAMIKLLQGADVLAIPYRIDKEILSKLRADNTSLLDIVLNRPAITKRDIGSDALDQVPFASMAKLANHSSCDNTPQQSFRFRDLDFLHPPSQVTIDFSQYFFMEVCTFLFLLLAMVANMWNMRRVIRKGHAREVARRISQAEDKEVEEKVAAEEYV